MPEMIRHTGGCHCGKVRFEVRAPAHLEVTQCNCSMCSKVGYLHLTNYQFNTRTAKHLFCSVCGIKSFYVPRSHPEGFSVNARCLDEGTITGMTVSQTDGKNWEKFYPLGRGHVLEE
jgi:hypothetical protein